MKTPNWKEIDYWKDIYEKEGGLESPFSDSPLSSKSIFLWNQMGAPLPSGALNGVWGCFPEPKALVGFLRYIVLPTFFGIWLVRNEWDSESDAFRSAEEMLSMARQFGNRSFKKDIAIMEEILTELDPLFDKSDVQVRNGLQKVQESFNKHWADTPTWTFEIQVYDKPEDVGEAIFRRLAEDEIEEVAEETLQMSRAEWIEICRKAPTGDRVASRKFKEVLEQNAWF